MSNRKVWYKHYPTDWRADKKLRLVSRSARSFWLDCIGLMQEDGTHRLEVAGRPMTTKELADTLGDHPKTAAKLLKELVDFEVCSVDQQGYIISRRILRELKKAEKDRLNGLKGGNPALKIRENEEEGVNPQDKAQKPEARDQIDDDDSARARSLDFREKICEAAGHDPTGVTATGAIFACRGTFEGFKRLLSQLSISDDDAIAVVGETARQKTGPPPNSLKYFHPALSQFAANRDVEPPKNVVGFRDNSVKSFSAADIRRMATGG